jgi:hypothetical protein
MDEKVNIIKPVQRCLFFWQKRIVIIQRKGISSYAGMRTSKPVLTCVMPQPDSSGEGVRH